MDALSVAQVSQSTVVTVWLVSLALVLTVAVVVAALLEQVRRTALGILEGAGDIWTNGKLVARDTVQIAVFLKTTNDVVGQILATAKQIVGATDAIEQHADGCPGCPYCVLGGQ